MVAQVLTQIYLRSRKWAPELWRDWGLVIASSLLTVPADCGWKRKSGEMGSTRSSTAPPPAAPAHASTQKALDEDIQDVERTYSNEVDKKPVAVQYDRDNPWFNPGPAYSPEIVSDFLQAAPSGCMWLHHCQTLSLKIPCRTQQNLTVFCGIRCFKRDCPAPH